MDADSFETDRIGQVPGNGYDGESPREGRPVEAVVGSLSGKAGKRTATYPKNKMSTKDTKWYNDGDMILITCTTKTRCGHCDARGGAAHGAQCRNGGRDYRAEVEAALFSHIQQGGTEASFQPPAMVPTGLLNAEETKFIQEAQASAYTSSLAEVFAKRRSAKVKKTNEDTRLAVQQSLKEQEAKKMKPSPAAVAHPQFPGYPVYGAMPPQPGYGGFPHPYSMSPSYPPYALHPQMFPHPGMMPGMPAPAAAVPDTPPAANAAAGEAPEVESEGEDDAMSRARKAKLLKKKVTDAEQALKAARAAATKAAKK
jgi:hypothetical protein